MHEPNSGISFGDVFGGIRDSYFAAHDIVINQVLGGERGEHRALEKLHNGVAELWVNGLLAKSIGDGRFVSVSLTNRTDLCVLQKGRRSVLTALTIEDLERQTHLGEHNSVLILGDAGSGKTTLLLGTC